MELKKVALNDVHEKLGAKMVPFAGYNMPVRYSSDIEEDWNWISKFNSNAATMTNISDDICLFAIQGPKASGVLQKLTKTDLAAIKYYHFSIGEFAGEKDVVISNTGYTGAGGFEIY